MVRWSRSAHVKNYSKKNAASVRRRPRFERSILASLLFVFLVGHRFAAAFAFAGVLTLAAGIAGLATALALAVILALAVVLAAVGFGFFFGAGIGVGGK